MGHHPAPQNITNTMKLLNHASLRLILLLVTGFLTGCAAPSQTAPAKDTVLSAITCDRCRTVWIQRAERSSTFRGAAGPYVLRTEGHMVCPDCESAAETFFRTGALKHRCSHCGGTMSHCTQHSERSRCCSTAAP